MNKIALLKIYDNPTSEEYLNKKIKVKVKQPLVFNKTVKVPTEALSEKDRQFVIEAIKKELPHLVNDPERTLHVYLNDVAEYAKNPEKLTGMIPGMSPLLMNKSTRVAAGPMSWVQDSKNFGISVPYKIRRFPVNLIKNKIHKINTLHEIGHLKHFSRMRPDINPAKALAELPKKGIPTTDRLILNEIIADKHLNKMLPKYNISKDIFSNYYLNKIHKTPYRRITGITNFFAKKLSKGAISEENYKFSKMLSKIFKNLKYWK